MTLLLSEVTTLGSVPVLLDKALRAINCEPEPLFEKAGIAYADLGQPNSRVATLKAQKLWKLAIQATGDPCFGLTAAQQFQPAALYGLGFAWLASDTLYDGLARLARYSRLINAIVDIRLEETDSTVDLVILGPEKWPDFEYAAADCGMAIFLKMCQITACDEVMPLNTAMQRPVPACTERFREIFGSNVSYGADTNSLSFDKTLVQTPLATAHPELARINDQTVIDYLAQFDRASITMQVRSKIIEQLPDGRPNQENIAESLHVSLRSLQRRLKNEQTTFKSLLTTTQQELAMHYVKNTRRSIGEITYLLGFSEPSNFTRAFKRWTGKAPAEFRTSV